MAASVNSIAAVFAAGAHRTGPPPPQATSPPRAAALPSSSAAAAVRPIAATWNRHNALPRRRRSSLLSVYGPPGPLPRPPPPLSLPLTPGGISAGNRLPASPLSYLDRDGAVRTVTLGNLSRGRKALVLAAPAAFAPSFSGLSPEKFVKWASGNRRNGLAAVVVTANDVYVMRAWGEHLEAEAGGVMMLSDPDAGLARALGLVLDMSGGIEGFGVRSDGYLMVVANGLLKAIFFNGGLGSASVATGLDDVLRLA